MYKITTITDWLLVVDDLLNHDQCQSLINKTEPLLKKSTLLGDQIDNYRTSNDFFYEQGSEENLLFSNLITDLLGIDCKQHEDLSIIKYQQNQQYKEHYDFLFHIKNELKRGGDRIFTFLLYLNDNFTGGETYFPKLDIAFEPKVGRALIWKNYIDGLPNYESLHCGLAVNHGEKWIATKWIREFEFK